MSNITQVGNAKLIKLTIERIKFLDEHPELQEFQNSIDMYLKKAGKNQHNRCVMIQTMLIEHLQKLQMANTDLLESIEDLSHKYENLKKLKDHRDGD